ncbi:hypothetical protein GOODEAATRI_029741, partial [Goodea atripinnis]
SFSLHVSSGYQIISPSRPSGTTRYTLLTSSWYTSPILLTDQISFSFPSPLRPAVCIRYAWPGFILYDLHLIRLDKLDSYPVLCLLGFYCPLSSLSFCSSICISFS